MRVNAILAVSVMLLLCQLAESADTGDVKVMITVKCKANGEIDRKEGTTIRIEVERADGKKVVVSHTFSTGVVASDIRNTLVALLEKQGVKVKKPLPNSTNICDIEFTIQNVKSVTIQEESKGKLNVAVTPTGDAKANVKPGKPPEHRSKPKKPPKNSNGTVVTAVFRVVSGDTLTRSKHIMKVSAQKPGDPKPTVVVIEYRKSDKATASSITKDFHEAFKNQTFDLKPYKPGDKAIVFMNVTKVDGAYSSKSGQVAFGWSGPVRITNEGKIRFPKRTRRSRGSPGPQGNNAGSTNSGQRGKNRSRKRGKRGSRGFKNEFHSHYNVLSYGEAEDYIISGRVNDGHLLLSLQEDLEYAPFYDSSDSTLFIGYEDKNEYFNVAAVSHANAEVLWKYEFPLGETLLYLSGPADIEAYMICLTRNGNDFFLYLLEIETGISLYTHTRLDIEITTPIQFLYKPVENSGNPLFVIMDSVEGELGKYRVFVIDIDEPALPALNPGGSDIELGQELDGVGPLSYTWDKLLFTTTRRWHDTDEYPALVRDFWYMKLYDTFLVEPLPEILHPLLTPDGVQIPADVDYVVGAHGLLLLTCQPELGVAPAELLIIDTKNDFDVLEMRTFNSLISVVPQFSVPDMTDPADESILQDFAVASLSRDTNLWEMYFFSFDAQAKSIVEYPMIILPPEDELVSWEFYDLERVLVMAHQFVDVKRGVVEDDGPIPITTPYRVDVTASTIVPLPPIDGINDEVGFSFSDSNSRHAQVVLRHSDGREITAVYTWDGVLEYIIADPEFVCIGDLTLSVGGTRMIENRVYTVVQPDIADCDTIIQESIFSRDNVTECEMCEMCEVCEVCETCETCQDCDMCPACDTCEECETCECDPQDVCDDNGCPPLPTPIPCAPCGECVNDEIRCPACADEEITCPSCPDCEISLASPCPPCEPEACRPVPCEPQPCYHDDDNCICPVTECTPQFITISTSGCDHLIWSCALLLALVFFVYF